VSAQPLTTARQRLVPGQAGEGGYRALVRADGEQHTARDDLADRALRAAWHRSARPLLVIAQLSDTHVMDHQSPGRAELLDRYSDPDSPPRSSAGSRASSARAPHGRCCCSATIRWRRW
jgi:hypothetical protein